MNGNPNLSAKVLSVVQKTGQDTSGAFVSGREVTYQLSNGHTGSVFVPLSIFSTDAVQQAILADAKTLADVASLNIPLQ